MRSTPRLGCGRRDRLNAVGTAARHAVSTEPGRGRMPGGIERQDADGTAAGVRSAPAVGMRFGSGCRRSGRGRRGVGGAIRPGARGREASAECGRNCGLDAAGDTLRRGRPRRRSAVRERRGRPARVAFVGAGPLPHVGLPRRRPGGGDGVSGRLCWRGLGVASPRGPASVGERAGEAGSEERNDRRTEAKRTPEGNARTPGCY